MKNDPSLGSHGHARSGPKSSLGLNLISLLSLAGLALNIYLTVHFYAVRGGTAGFKSACNLGAAMNCDAVAASPYAELVAGIPLSSFGSGWFLALFIMSVVVRLDDWSSEGNWFLGWMGALGAVISLRYLFVMSFVLKTYCIFCLGVEAVSVLLPVIAFTQLKPGGLGKFKHDMGKVWTTAAIVAGSLVVATVLLKSMDDTGFSRQDVADRANSVLSSPVLAVGTGDEFPSIGPKTASVTVVEFSDFQCPFCRLGAFTLNTVLNRYPDKVRVVFRNFPLNPSCNPNITHAMHEFACDAAKVAYCAGKQGKFAGVYEALFENQAEFSAGETGKPEYFAKDAGISMDALTACEGSGDPGVAIARDVEEATHLGVQSTPTFFVNGHKMEGVAPVPVWISLIDSLTSSTQATR